MAMTLLLSARFRASTNLIQVSSYVQNIVIGVIIIVVTALGALRAATLAYAAGLVAAMLATRGFTPASASAIAIGALFAFGTLNVSRRHLATLAARRQARDAEQLARRLVTAYEAHGPGWFWQTDRSGRVTYLSAKVADEFAGFGVATEAAALTSLFRVDVEATGTARNRWCQEHILQASTT